MALRLSSPNLMIREFSCDFREIFVWPPIYEKYGKYGHFTIKREKFTKIARKSTKIHEYPRKSVSEGFRWIGTFSMFAKITKITKIGTVKNREKAVKKPPKAVKSA